ncbi:hypothetical protein MAM1_0090d04870 [Mucor ambiguus]|uniref:Uncharacterized protein n=1 Tax=Mucor ambiguus TaxID=91626 RepID=A0A0C9MDL0_9FUNG|nr:hypothetical protein MAM1_0090d04870 [Mucor ambiguus]
MMVAVAGDFATHVTGTKLEEKIGSMKQTFGSIVADPTSVVLTALATYCQDYEFADVHIAWNGAEEARTKEEADMFVNIYCSQLVSSIIVSSKGSWIYVTQAEAYMRNARNVDECANTTITIINPAKARFINILLDIATNDSFKDENEGDDVDNKANNNGIANAVEAKAINGHAEQEAIDQMMLPYL